MSAPALHPGSNSGLDASGRVALELVATDRENRSMGRLFPTVRGSLMAAAILVAATPAFAGYGAIAWDRTSGKYGGTWNQATAQAAAERALSDCGATGCKVIMRTGTGQCAALATIASGKFVGAASRKTVEEARLAALSNCQKGNAGDCVVRASNCNK